MPTYQKLYLMLHEETDHSPDYGQFVKGDDPVSAVEGHYAEMDAWCSPVLDPNLYDEFCIWMHEIPEHLSESIQLQFEGLGGGDYSAATAAMLAANPDIKPILVNVIYTAADGATASLMPDVSQLGGGL